MAKERYAGKKISLTPRAAEFCNKLNFSPKEIKTIKDIVRNPESKPSQNLIRNNPSLAYAAALLFHPKKGGTVLDVPNPAAAAKEYHKMSKQINQAFSQKTQEFLVRNLGLEGYTKVLYHLSMGAKRLPNNEAGFVAGLMTRNRSGKWMLRTRAASFYLAHKNNAGKVSSGALHAAFWKDQPIKIKIAKKEKGPSAKEKAMKAGGAAGVLRDAKTGTALASVAFEKPKWKGKEESEELKEAMKGAKMSSVSEEHKKTLKPPKGKSFSITMPERKGKEEEEKKEYAAKLPNYKISLGKGKRTPFDLAEEVAMKMSDVKKSKDRLKKINELLPDLRKRAVTAIGGEEKMPDIITKEAQKKNAVRIYLVTMRMQRNTEERIKKLNNEVRGLRKELRPKKKA